MLSKLKKIYPNQAKFVYEEINKLIKDYKKRNPVKSSNNRILFSEKDIVLICYADHVKESGIKTFKTMHKFLFKFARGIINRVHFLPFYPWSSDDGFSVKDYYRVKKTYGDWKDISVIKKNFNLMFDCVLNHTSVQGEWFKKFLKNNKKYEDFFISFSKDEYKKNVNNFQKVFRPRKDPLFTKFKTKNGEKYVWTTFSKDQADLNFNNHKVFLELIKILLFYAENGASAIRLDAIAYVWKKLGTNCFNLKETHLFVQVIREILKKVAPDVWLVTETVLPDQENINYFGDGGNEAHLVYHFQLETLILYTILKGDSGIISNWLKNIIHTSDIANYLNLSISHDGIHTIPAKGILNKKQIKELVRDCVKKGGKILERDIGNGKKEVYEINITYPSAIGNVKKYLVSQAIVLALQGVPLIYLNNLIGADNWSEGVERLGYGRAINREKFNYKKIKNQLNNKSSKKAQIYNGYKKLLKVRINEALFSPQVSQKILNFCSSLIVILRYKNNNKLLALFNVSNKEVVIKSIDIKRYLKKIKVKDILSKKFIKLDKDLVLQAYEVKWLK